MFMFTCTWRYQLGVNQKILLFISALNLVCSTFVHQLSTMIVSVYRQICFCKLKTWMFPPQLIPPQNVQLQRIIHRCSCKVFYANYGDVDPNSLPEVPMPVRSSHLFLFIVYNVTSGYAAAWHNRLCIFPLTILLLAAKGAKLIGPYSGL